MISKKLRSDLQTRKNRVFRADDETAFILELRGFFDFINSNPFLKGLVKELDLGRPEFAKENALQLSSQIPESEDQRVRHCLGILNYCTAIDEDSFYQFYLRLFLQIKGPKRIGDARSLALNFLRDTFFLPFYEYLDEHIEDYGVILFFLQRFKFRTETFDRERMYTLYKSDSSKSEALLDREVRKYLFDQGVDYPLSTPLSTSGRTDVVADLHTQDPLVLEIKILDLDRGYDRSYIRKGFKQIFDYANDYNKSVGYLLIFNASEVDINFNLRNKSELNIEIDGKTFYFVVVDIYEDTVPSSKRGKLQPYTIEESFLISAQES